LASFYTKAVLMIRQDLSDLLYKTVKSLADKVIMIDILENHEGFILKS
jgi:hypothetical protein